jgi:acetyl-CoA synthetase
MSDTYPVPDRVRDGSPNLIASMADYRDVYAKTDVDPDGFWLAWARANLQWHTPPTLGLEGDFHTVRDEPVRWFADGTLNVCENCVDRHLATRAEKTAILWEGDEPGDIRRISYRELHVLVQRAANALVALGVEKGDRVVIYMGMIPEAAVAMLACARIGAVHSVVFGGFSAESLRDRLIDSAARVLITQDEGRRGGKPVPLKKIADEAVHGASAVSRVLVVRHTGGEVAWDDARDRDWATALADADPTCAPTVCAAEDPLFILYTSGSTGKPKGLLHTQGGYLTGVSFTHRAVFDLREDDVYACMADVGWITGHSYIVYGPLANGATTMMFESIPVYPDAGRYWDVVERHRVTVFYTAPTALRTLAAQGDHFVKRHDRSSLRVLGTVGEPINPEAWRWYHDVVGDGRCTVVDTWWQTETGSISISPIAPATPTKPGSATLPMPGIFPLVVDSEGRPMRGPVEGRLCLREPWPSMARTVWNDHERYVGTYFSTYPGLYFTGDGCRRDRDGYIWITGRVDDVINVSGHRMGTAEFESALVTVAEVAEAGVVGFPHPIKGQGVYAYIVLEPGKLAGADLERKLHDAVRAHIGAHARVDLFQIIPGLPKTRSGKVMRRILRKVAEGDTSSLGDTSTLADPAVVDAIIAGAKRL